MKKIFFIMSVLLTAYSLQLTAQTYDSVASFTSKTTIGTTDIIPFQTKVSNKFTWRRMIGSNLWNQITDTTEARITALLNASNSWNGINNFDGATFNAGSHGGITANDSLFMGTGAFIYSKFIEPGTAGGRVGSASKYYTSMYSQNFVVINSGGTDSAYINFADGFVTFDRPIIGSYSPDSSSSITNIGYGVYNYTISNMSDSVLTLQDTSAVIYFNLPGNVANMERIVYAGDEYGSGRVVKIFNDAAVDIITFKDYDAGDADHNLQLAGDFAMGQYDFLELMYVDIAGTFYWIEISRSNN